MDFDTYWKNLVTRVHTHHEELAGVEDTLYRLSCIYGETMVDGIESYFERRFEEFEQDMEVLKECGFGGVAADFSQARDLLFGSSPLSTATVVPVVSRLLDERDEDRPTLDALDDIYTRLIASLPKVARFRDNFGREKGLYDNA